MGPASMSRGKGRPIIAEAWEKDLIMVRRCRQRLELALQVSEPGSRRYDEIERTISLTDKLIETLDSWAV